MGVPLRVHIRNSDVGAVADDRGWAKPPQAGPLAGTSCSAKVTGLSGLGDGACHRLTRLRHAQFMPDRTAEVVRQIAVRLAAISQVGTTYSRDDYDFLAGAGELLLEVQGALVAGARPWREVVRASTGRHPGPASLRRRAEHRLPCTGPPVAVTQAWPSRYLGGRLLRLLRPPPLGR